MNFKLRLRMECFFSNSSRLYLASFAQVRFYCRYKREITSYACTQVVLELITQSNSYEGIKQPLNGSSCPCRTAEDSSGPNFSLNYAFGSVTEGFRVVVVIVDGVKEPKLSMKASRRKIGA